jgi:hypothetical protein
MWYHLALQVNATGHAETIAMDVVISGKSEYPGDYT